MKGHAFSRRVIHFACGMVLVVCSLASAQTPQATPPPPASQRAVQFPRPVEQTFANGLRVIVVERSANPLVAAQLLVKNGGEVDPPELSGLADITASLLTKGTASRDATQIAEAIEALGGSLDAGARWDASNAIVSVMSSKIDLAMAILADGVRHPTFKDEEIERLRQQYLDNIRVSLGQPGAIARFVAARVAFGDAPYGHPLNGTPESLARITRPDIVKLHGQFYRPDNAILIIGGDIKPQNAFGLAKRYFGDWQKPSTPAPGPSKNSVIDGKGGRIVVIDKPDAGQAAVYLVRSGIERRDPDYFRGIVSNSVLSGYSGRLNQEIRIKRGLSYGAASTLDARRDTGPFVASAQTKNESGAQVADLLLGEISRLATAPPTEAELTPRKAVLVGTFSRNLEQVNGLVGQVGSLALYGLGLDEINKYIGSVQSITPADVQKFASLRLDAKGASIVIVGNAKEFLPELSKRFSEVEVIPVAELDLNTGMLRRKKPADE
ncbi:MAG TPA: pitrilysin family protein [Pyrinomonadaceae bacterium]|nr:pitrilysin family protein [Pyrinomonadaceae bacterium]